MFNKYKVKRIIDQGDSLCNLYNGIVVDVNDPGFQGDGKPLGRVKVQIPELTGSIPHDYLPWYPIKTPANSSPNSQGSVPPVGSEVVVEFPDRSIYNGLVSFVIISSPPS